jgi:hypothetical protein
MSRGEGGGEKGRIVPVEKYWSKGIKTKLLYWRNKMYLRMGTRSASLLFGTFG